MPYLGRTVVTNLADYHVDSYTHVGSSPSSSQFIAGTTSALTLTNAGVEDEQALSIYFNGLHQQHNTYSISSSVVTFDAAIPTGTDKVEIHYGTQPVTSGLAADSVGASQIAINSVAGTKIAMGSDAAGDILYYNGTDYIRLGKGTSGHFLKIGASAPSWAAPSGGGTALISTVNADDSAAIDIDVTGVSDASFIIGSGIVPATDDTELRLQVSIDGASSFVASTAYTYGMRDTVPQSWSSAAAGYILMGDANSNRGWSNVAAEAGMFTVYMANLKSTSIHPSFLYDVGTVNTNGTAVQRFYGYGKYDASTDDVTHVRFAMDSGIITSGRFSLYNFVES